MTEQQDRLAREREEIAARVASFKATQEKFEREREEYFVTTLENAATDPTASRSGPRSRFRCAAAPNNPAASAGLFALSALQSS